jgi:geranylgeranyl diphosphate synthase, type I
MSDHGQAVLSYRPQVEAALSAFITGRRQAPSGGLAWNRDVAERLRTYATTGKLLRGCLVCYSYGLENEAAPTAAVLNTAVALELIHSSLLVHDDIIDRDDTRRGRPALHTQYSHLSEGQFQTDRQHFGNSMALCAGDMALFWAFGLLNAAPDDVPTSTALGGLFSRVLAAVCAGQMEDIYQGASSGRPSKQTIYSLMRCKTAAYSVALPLAAGAVLDGRPVNVQEQLYELGLAAGIIFQIRDDELGMFGQPRILGKPVGSDIREGKKTLLYYYLWRSASPNEKRYLKTVFGNAKASQADIITVQKALRRYGVRDRLKQDTDRLEQSARRLINRLPLSQTGRDKLRQVVAFCADRQL